MKLDKFELQALEDFPSPIEPRAFQLLVGCANR